jgi:hypothetical protein
MSAASRKLPGSICRLTTKISNAITAALADGRQSASQYSFDDTPI